MGIIIALLYMCLFPRIKWEMPVDHLEQCLVCTKCSVNISCVFLMTAVNLGDRATPKIERQVSFVFFFFFQRPKAGFSSQHPRRWHRKGETQGCLLSQRVRGRAPASRVPFGRGNSLASASLSWDWAIWFHCGHILHPPAIWDGSETC